MWLKFYGHTNNTFFPDGRLIYHGKVGQAFTITHAYLGIYFQSYLSGDGQTNHVRVVCISSENRQRGPSKILSLQIGLDIIVKDKAKDDRFEAKNVRWHSEA